MKKGNAFTLLEMLIVLGIIAVIIAIASISYSTAQKKSRDSRRQSDLKAVQSAMEQYYSICGYVYPVSAGGNGGQIPTIGCTNPATILMSAQATDPRTTTPYLMPTTAATQYKICAGDTELIPTVCVSNQQ